MCVPRRRWVFQCAILNCSTTGVHQVSAGTHTFALTISQRDTVGFRGANIWAQFVLFDGEGNTP